MRRFGMIVLLYLGAGFLIWRYGWMSIFPSLYLATVATFATFSKYRIAIVLFGLFVIAGFVLPSIFAVAPTVRRMQCSENLKQISDAIAAYEKAYGRRPPPYTASRSGVPLLSWRVLLLPYIGEMELYNEIDMEAPWNDPENRRVSERIPKVFCCPESIHQSKWLSTGTQTTYVGVFGENTMWARPNSLKSQDDRDKFGEKILVIESEKYKCDWMFPSDVTFQRFLSNFQPNTAHGDFAHFVTVSGKIGLVTSKNYTMAEVNELFEVK